MNLQHEVLSARSDSLDRRTIDLRTDTITLPTQAMRTAMAAAPVGDDFYDEDPTVKALEARAAEVLGKEQGLYLPSGTMGNLLAHLTHAPGGGEVLGPEQAHTFTSEGGGPSRVAGMTVRPVPQAAARLDLDCYRSLVHRASVLAPATALIWVEQPTRGYVVPLADLEELRRIASESQVPVHFDGARIFNAAVALGVSAATIAEHADSVMFCVSKGLAAPIGSVLVGTREFIVRARQLRQMLGGGMRQAGIVAAGGLYALEHHVDRLADDHRHAARLADAMRGMDGIRVDREAIQTNIFYVEVVREGATVQAFADALKLRGVLINRPGAGRRSARFVTSIGVDSADIDRAIEIIADALDAPDAAPSSSGRRS